MTNTAKPGASVWLIFIISAVLLSLMTVFVQVREFCRGEFLRQAVFAPDNGRPTPDVPVDKLRGDEGMGRESLGLRFLDDGLQTRRHTRVIQGKAGSPWQYRVLPEYMVEALIRLVGKLGIGHPNALAFIAFRLFQNFLLFVLAAAYYRRLGLSTYVTLIGLSLLAWGMTQSLYRSDLQFNTYFDVVFYLAAGLAIASGRVWWIVPITLLAALNRETSGLIPVMTLAAGLSFGADRKPHVAATPAIVAAVSLALFIAVFLALRASYGWQPTVLAYGHRFGIDLFTYNVGRYVTWINLFATLGLLPIMAVASIRSWPPVLRRFFWTLVPVWVLVHLIAAVMAETRLFLVPHALVIIPGALFGISHVISSRADTTQ